MLYICMADALYTVCNICTKAQKRISNTGDNRSAIYIHLEAPHMQDMHDSESATSCNMCTISCSHMRAT
jgi:hypothetical protein